MAHGGFAGPGKTKLGKIRMKRNQDPFKPWYCPSSVLRELPRVRAPCGEWGHKLICFQRFGAAVSQPLPLPQAKGPGWSHSILTPSREELCPSTSQVPFAAPEREGLSSEGDRRHTRSPQHPQLWDGHCPQPCGDAPGTQTPSLGREGNSPVAALKKHRFFFKAVVETTKKPCKPRARGGCSPSWHLCESR